MAQIRNFAFDITSATTTDFVDPQQKVMKAVKRRSLAESQNFNFSL